MANQNSTSNKKVRRQKFLSDFVIWYENGMKATLHNVLELQKVRPDGLNNRILKFVVPRAMNSVADKFILEVYQAWELLNLELREQNLKKIYKTQDFRDLKIMRDKLIAHGIENLSISDKFHIWYKSEYGSLEKVFALILRIAKRIKLKIEMLESSGKITSSHASGKYVAKFNYRDVEALVELVKKSNLNH